MEIAPCPSLKYLRQLSAHLALCGLSHWREVLLQWIEHYAGLERMVDDDREGPQAAVIRLLRDINASALLPTDPDFSRYLADLAFLNYRVRRARTFQTVETAEQWQPLLLSLPAYRSGHDIGAWRALTPPVPHEAMAEELLRRVQGVCVDVGNARH